MYLEVWKRVRTSSIFLYRRHYGLEYRLCILFCQLAISLALNITGMSTSTTKLSSYGSPSLAIPPPHLPKSPFL